MPYVDGPTRARMAAHPQPQTLGELDYLITTIVLIYMREQKIAKFDQLAGIIGTLDLIKDECRRRIVHPYEDLKRGANGDVFP